MIQSLHGKNDHYITVQCTVGIHEAVHRGVRYTRKSSRKIERGDAVPAYLTGDLSGALCQLHSHQSPRAHSMAHCSLIA